MAKFDLYDAGGNYIGSAKTNTDDIYWEKEKKTPEQIEAVRKYHASREHTWNEFTSNALQFLLCGGFAGICFFLADLQIFLLDIILMFAGIVAAPMAVGGFFRMIYYFILFLVSDKK